MFDLVGGGPPSALPFGFDEALLSALLLPLPPKPELAEALLLVWPLVLACALDEAMLLEVGGGAAGVLLEGLLPWPLELAFGTSTLTAALATGGAPGTATALALALAV